MTTNKYAIKALDAYPYNLEEAVESLEYALSYNNEDITALCLMGRMQAEIFKDFENSKQYFLDALAINVHALEIYPFYINTLLWNEDYEDVIKFIDFALTVKGSDKAWLLYRKACVFEAQNKLNKTLKCIQKSKEKSCNPGLNESIKELETRVQAKLDSKKGKSKKQKTK